MAYLVYDKSGELEDVVELNSLDEVDAYEKAHPKSELEFAGDEDEVFEIDEEDNADDNTDLSESEW